VNVNIIHKTTCFISCKKCNSCKICGKQLQYHLSSGNDECDYCEELKRQKENEIIEEERQKELEKKKIIFQNKWKKSKPLEKLSFYGKEKLLVLAKQKNISGRYNMTKKELIDELSLIVTENDFPIKK